MICAAHLVQEDMDDRPGEGRSVQVYPDYLQIMCFCEQLTRDQVVKALPFDRYSDHQPLRVIHASPHSIHAFQGPYGQRYEFEI